MDALKFKESALNRWKFWLGMWKDLPSVAFWGIKVKDLNDTSCVVVVPFNYRSKNPFRSIYFGALSGAAELATGLLCKKLILERGNFSMLVTGFRAEFTKKATSATFFTCDQGKELAVAAGRVSAATFPFRASRDHRIEGLRPARRQGN